MNLPASTKSIPMSETSSNNVAAALEQLISENSAIIHQKSNDKLLLNEEVTSKEETETKVKYISN